MGMTEEMKRVVTEIQLCYAATVTPDGKPNLSPKGSITVLSDDELGFADLASPGTIENLRHNPAISSMWWTRSSAGVLGSRARRRW
jgi:uncharacterized protein